MSSLPQLVARALEAAGVGVGDLDAVAVSIGPGSFTGLRIGLAFAKGLAYAGRVAIAPVSTLLALAHVADAQAGETICAAIDARRGEIYAALFTCQAGGALTRESPDRAWTPSALAVALPEDAIVIGDVAEADWRALGPRIRVLGASTHPPHGGIVARLGGASIRAGGCWDVRGLEPVYVRPADAQLPTTPLR